MSITLKIGLFHLLVTDCFMCHIVIVDRYKYKCLRRDSFVMTWQKQLSYYLYFFSFSFLYWTYY